MKAGISPVHHSFFKSLDLLIELLSFASMKEGVMGRVITATPVFSSKKGGGSILLEKAFEQFKTQMIGKGYAEKTIRTYSDHLGDFIQFANSTIKGKGFHVCLVTQDIIIEWQAHLRFDLHNVDTSVRTKVKSLRTFLYWCMEEDREYCRPFRIKLPAAEERLKELYSVEEMEAILRQPRTRDLTEWRNWAVVNMVLRTGIRRSSLCELKWFDIDFEGRKALLRHSKNRKQQYVPLADEAIEVLAIWRDYSPETQEGYVFFSTYSEKKLQPNSMTQAIRKYNLKRGVSKTSLHLMRHSFATIYLRKGGQIGKLQKILGHQTMDMTQRYVHYLTEDLVEDINDFTV